MSTLDLELEIGRGNGGSYPLLARMSGDEVTATMRLPLTFAEIDHRLTVIKSEVLASSVPRPATGEDEQPARELGRELFEALLGDEVRELYAAGRERARADSSTFRLVLRVRPPELVRLPWELMVDPGEQDEVGLSVSLVRSPGALAPRQPLSFEAPLRILGLVARPGEQHQVDQEQQRLGAVQRDGLVKLEWAAGPTLRDLEEALDRGPWHAFHFVGYGGGDPVADQRTVALTHGAGRDHLAGADDLTRLLADHDTLRLVVLSARDTGPSGASDAFSTTAGKLIRGGVPAVVAMQFDITDAAAIVFAETLYHNVARCLPVDIGVTRARRAVRLAKRDTLEWATPALYLRNPDGRILTGAAGRSGSEPAGAQAGRSEVESLYEEALSAFWAEQWDQAIALLHKVLAHHPDHPDAGAKLEQASREHDLATRYAQTRAALDAGDWEQAVEGFAALADADPAYLDVRDLLDDARLRRDSAELADETGEEVADPVPLLPELPRIARHPESGLIVHSRMELSAVAFSPDGARLATANNKNVAQIWDTGTGQELLALGTKAWRRSMEGVAFSPDGDRLATASDDGTARIWDATSGEELLKVSHDGQVWGVVFSPDGDRLATAGDDCTARIWDVSSGEELLNLPHDNWVRGLAFSPDGCWLATAGVDRTARVLDATDGREFAKVTHDSVVWAAVFSPDGRWLATASDDGTARIWDAALGEQLLEVVHDSGVLKVAFSPDGCWLATASQDRTARVWDVATGAELATVTHPDQVWGVAFSPDGNRLATVSSDRTARIWVLMNP